MKNRENVTNLIIGINGPIWLFVNVTDIPDWYLQSGINNLTQQFHSSQNDFGSRSLTPDFGLIEIIVVIRSLCVDNFDIIR